ncbi:phosphatase PAP2 family protein [Clostridium felsineum]|uniref:Uncharacterized protein n=1 Tax=Clostridium felsineum TaxID=36839 RepID=A0A1S8L210_9CLOT|nr:phosphatase PAP2 family protein [Clostridium felsineum]URZ05334.1 hypothetical protein CLROS_006580 [Clostridium felsineum]URZ10375.1 hypothetical protein CROST_010830 [Clostridium felsineum]
MFANNILTGQYNIEIIKFLQQFSNPFLDKIAEAVTMTAEEYFIIAFIAIIYLCIDKKLGYIMAVTILYSSIINYYVKSVFKIKRPIGTFGIRSLRLQTADGYSFPSGHTQGATVFWLSLVKHIKKTYIYFIAAIMIILVGISRIYLGVHRPIDVIGGFIFGSFCVEVLNRTNKLKKYKKNLVIFLVIIFPMMAITIYINDAKLYQELGAVLGFIIGHDIQEKYIKFNPKTNAINNIIKILITILGMIILKVLFDAILPKMLVFYFIKYFCILLWFTTGNLYLITKICKTSSL